MSWLRTLISKLRRRPLAPSPELREAERALERTEQRLGVIRGEASAILGIADQLVQLGEQNDFAARLRTALGGPRE
ncbi:hypothetical protein [Streptomyces sp. S1D4-14]|uniref:DUF7620 family protein n=1 Tax=Streptomyces sp. S1D4-14 TaxID=2594461 RepID=UPI001162BE78|nr:hypothetical protein [Streptomyces sp. S1D4-14]QDN64456.1 hypothetical protein FNV66_01080 [Streptomyces sp. S1D4-14]